MFGRITEPQVIVITSCATYDTYCQMNTLKAWSSRSLQCVALLSAKLSSGITVL